MVATERGEGYEDPRGYPKFPKGYKSANYYTSVDEFEVSDVYYPPEPDKVKVGWRSGFKRLYEENDLQDCINWIFHRNKQT